MEVKLKQLGINLDANTEMIQSLSVNNETNINTIKDFMKNYINPDYNLKKTTTQGNIFNLETKLLSKIDSIDLNDIFSTMPNFDTGGCFYYD